MTDEVLAFLQDSLKKHHEWKYEIKIGTWQTDFLRFFRSQTNYNISKEQSYVAVQIYEGKKGYVFSMDNPQIPSLKNALENVEKIMKNLPEDPFFVDVEDDLTRNTENRKANNIEELSLDAKISILQGVAQEARKLDFDLFGTFICNYQYNRILNSNGLDKHYWSSPIYFETKAVHSQSQVTVLETFGGEDFKLFDEQQFIQNLKHKMLNALNERIDVEPGEYEVVLAPRCAAELMMYLSYLMSARSLDQKVSYFEDKKDTQVFPENVSITDDPSDKELISREYSGNGHIYRPLKLIEKGVFRNFMTSNYYSHKLKMEKNGNEGWCFVLGSGNVSLGDMISKINKGLYISSLHYMNFINPKETSITGLTRDGTFLIENGKITRVVNNLRFTEKLSRIFENIVNLEDKATTIPFSDNYEAFDIRSSKAPHIQVRNFNITSSTKTI